MQSEQLAASDLIYDWNGPPQHPAGAVQLLDQTLREGLQAAHVRHPDVDEKLHLLSLMDDLGVDLADVGFPCADERQLDDIVEIGRARAAGQLCLRLECGARTVLGDVRAVFEASERSGYPFEAGIFIGSSNIRRFIEGWDLPEMIRRVRESVSLATRHGLRVMFVTEDTTRAHPETIRVLYDAAISEGATRLCIADTAGHATPRGVARLLEFFKREVVRGQRGLEVVWHGHGDLGLAVANSLAAVESGAHAVEATALGIGERAGNTATEALLAHLFLQGLRQTALVSLVEYAEYAARILRYPIPANQPIVGADVFSHGAGVHAAAIRKALDLGRPDLADIVYSPLAPQALGRIRGVGVGRMAGRSNVILALGALGVEPTEELVGAVLDAAKVADSPLTDAQIRGVVAACGGVASQCR